MPLLLGPFHIAVLEMIIDPVCALVFEAEVEEGDLLERPPRPSDEPLVSRGLVGGALVQGALILFVTAGLSLGLWRTGLDADLVRSATFLALVLGIVALILVNRRFSASLASAVRRSNPALAVVLGLVAMGLLASQVLPALAGLFRFAPLGLSEAALVLFAGLSVFLGLEGLKAFWLRRRLRLH
jgi:Ca2+-transporting ATPase